MNILISEYPLLVLPRLAQAIGLNEAIVLQQVHYWLLKTGKEIDSRKWVYNTYEEWQQQFPFWSISTIKRTIANLEEKGLLITGNYNKINIDRTKWYTIEYSLLVQIDTSIGSEWNDQGVKLTPPIPETTTETTPDIKEDIVEDDKRDYEKEFENIWESYPEKKGKTQARTKVISLLKKNKITAEELIECTVRYTNYVKHRRATDFKDLKYKNGSTFFTSGYEDYLDCNYKGGEDGQVTGNTRKTYDIKHLINNRPASQGTGEDLL